jgi:DNA-binding CsgD family transcriptional regulator
MTDGIVGRNDELAVFEAFLDGPVNGPRALVLEGEAGIGKSTIWLAAVAAARARSCRVLSSRPAENERTLPYVVLGDLFADVEVDELAVLETPRRRALESALLRGASESPVDPRALGVAIHTLIPTLADRQPLVLAIDDDQWMDPSSGATLQFAFRRLLDQPLLLVLARRVGDEPGATLEGVLDPSAVVHVLLGPLSVGAIQSLLRQRLEITLPRSALLEVHEQSGGNPFFAMELARATEGDPAAGARRLAVPRSLERLVNDRIETLDQATRRALLLIAAHGRFPVALLGTLNIPPAAIAKARAARVIETDGDVVRFTHPLLASSLYQGADSDDRMSAHRQLADVVDDVVHRGRHLALASDGPSETLAAALEAAAHEARFRGMPIASAELAEHALRLTPPEYPDHRHRRAIGAGRAQMEAGEGGRARAIAAQLLAQAAPGGQKAEALMLSAELEDVAPAVALLEEALAEAVESPALQVAIEIELAGVGRSLRGREWAEPHAASSLHLSEGLNDPALRAAALSAVALTRFERGDGDGLDLLERAYNMTVSLADPRHLVWTGEGMAFALTHSGDTARARQWLESRLAEWRDRDEWVRSSILWNLALVEVWSGRWVIASQYADDVRNINVQYGESSPDHLAPALIAMHRGQIPVAMAHSQRALDMANGHLLPQHLGILGVCELWRGMPKASLANFADAERAAETRGWREPNLRWWRGEYAGALLQLGRINEADRIVAEWETDALRLGRGRILAHATRCRGQIAAARGDLLTAQDLLEEAVDRHQAIDDPFGRARALLALGVVRLRVRQKRAAREALEAAHAAFGALGAMSWATTARAELERIGGRGRIEGLSPSELRVAELVAMGRTNREIASALFLGERTVASHLTHVYAKLGIRSRTELARMTVSGLTGSAEVASKVPTS